MMTNRQIKGFALRQLKGNWVSTIAAFFISMLILSVTVSVPVMVFFAVIMLELSLDMNGIILVGAGIVIAFFVFIYYALAVGLSLGMQRMYLKLARGGRVSISELFHGFRSLRHFLNYLSVNLLITGMGLIIFIPCFIAMFVYGVDSSNAQIAQWIGNVLSVVLSLFFAGAAVYSADVPERTAIQSLKLSLRVMEGRKWRFFVLLISFIPWTLLSILTLGIGFIVLTPYMNAAETIFFLSAYSEEMIG